jgi:hypothetical protein
MELIQNTFIGFRCPNTLKEKLIDYAEKNNIHVSKVIRQAISTKLKTVSANSGSNRAE